MITNTLIYFPKSIGNLFIMDGFRNAHAPSSYQEVQWLADTFVALMGLGWLVNYGLMIWHARKGETYSMALIPLCNNIGWELVYTLVYPSSNQVELVVFGAAVCLNAFIMITAARSTKTEWSHSPLVAENAPCLLCLGTAVCFSGHVALAMEIGPALAYSWGAVICQLALSIGSVCQLLQRNSTRGTSWALW
jgi:paspaline synthase